MGWGGKRERAGRKPTKTAPPKEEPTPSAAPPSPIDALAALATPDKTPAEIMDAAMRVLFSLGHLKDAAKVAADIEKLKGAKAQAPGKKQAALDLAHTSLGEDSRLAPRPPPKLN